MIICLIYVGKVPPYARYCVQQIRAWSSLPIYFITNDIENSKELLCDFDITYVNSDQLKSEKILKLEELRQHFSLTNWIQNREHLFYYSCLRLFLLEAFMSSRNIKDVFHMEVDNLIYFDPNEFKSQFTKKGLAYLYEGKDRGCAGIFFARDSESLSHLNSAILGYIDVTNDSNNEMSFLGRYVEEFDNVYTLPHIFPTKAIDKKIYENYKDFDNWLFDSMSIGMWLTGIDKIHSNGLLKKCKSKWIELDFTTFNFDWKYNKKGKKYPVIFDEVGKEHRIFNLHVHSKDLSPYLSTHFKVPSNRTIISGEAFQKVCHLFVDVWEEDKGWIPSLSDDNRHIHINNIPQNFDNPKLVYIRGWNLDRTFELISKFKNPFVLVAHNADEWIKNNQPQWLSHPKIIHFFSQNLCIRHPKATFLPIGIANSHWPHGNQDLIKNVMTRNIKKTKDIYFNFSIETAPWYRQDCLDKIQRKGVNWVPNKPYKEYLETIAEYKYAICPMGNGFDCHRTWECIYLGVIPIFLYHPFVEMLLPFTKCVILKSWDELPFVDGKLDEDKLQIYLPFSQSDEIYAEDYIKKIIGSI